VIAALPPLLALLAAASPLEAEEPHVQAGNEKLLSGDGAAALTRYDEAERAAGRHAEIDYDRGAALQRLGRHEDAKAAYRRALEGPGGGALSSRALQNMGNALDALGDREGAVRAFSDALARDPANEDARYNLEVLLRRRSEGKGAPRDQGDEGRTKKEGPRTEGKGEAPPPQPSPSPGQAGNRPQPRDGQAPEPSPAERPDGADRGRGDEARGEARGEEAGRAGGERGAGERQGEVAGDASRQGTPGRQDAERLLDALRARERQMPLGPAGRRESRRRDVEKDW
jgi:Ca-activated chloride channel family protein